MIIVLCLCRMYKCVCRCVCRCMCRCTRLRILHLQFLINPLNAKLNPICHFLALLGADPILHVSRIRVKKYKTNGYEDFCILECNYLLIGTEGYTIRRSWVLLQLCSHKYARCHVAVDSSRLAYL